jgi:hypothetical protein
MALPVILAFAPRACEESRETARGREAADVDSHLVRMAIAEIGQAAEFALGILPHHGRTVGQLSLVYIPKGEGPRLPTAPQRQ